jgi:hypothetical protein
MRRRDGTSGGRPCAVETEIIRHMSSWRSTTSGMLQNVQKRVIIPEILGSFIRDRFFGGSVEPVSRLCGRGLRSGRGRAGRARGHLRWSTRVPRRWPR